MKTVFLYAGQGSQKVGMGADFYQEYPTYRAWIDGLPDGEKIKKLMHEGPIEELSRTENTQCCMAAFGAGITKLLLEVGIQPQAACGLSLGEYGALYAAGAYSAEDYVKIVTFRGRKMMEAAQGIDCAMSAVLGMDGQAIREVCQDYTRDNYRGFKKGYVTVANYNCPGQAVICGEEGAVAAVEARLKEKGCKRMVRLNVSGPFHTRFMKPAGDALEEFLKEIPFGKLQIPVTSNVTGGFYGESVCEQNAEYVGDSQHIKQLLVRQVQESVHLEDNLRTLLEAGYEHFVEIGPGNTMAGFLRKTARDMKRKVDVTSIERVEDLKKLIESE